MTPIHVGNYCGRTGNGWLGEPLVSFSNVAFVIAAALALRAWLAGDRRDRAALALIALAAAIGVGSFVFHSHPTPRTLPIDLIPIQIFGLAYAAFVVRRMFGASWPVTVAATAAFGLADAGWQRAVQGVLGGAAGHGLGVVAIAIAGAWLARRGDRRGHWLLAAAGSYTIALAFRAIDLPICARFPLGVHWVWHLVQGVTVGLLLRAAMACITPQE